MAEIVEKAVYDTSVQQLFSNYTMELVNVYNLCNETVPAHPGYSTSVRRLQSSLSVMQMLQIVSATGFSPARRLQTSRNEVKLYQVVSTVCSSNCEEEIFNNTATTLVKTIEDGTLTQAIQENSADVIQVTISPNVISNYTVTTSRPTRAPSSAPSQVGAKAGKLAKTRTP